MYLILRSIFEKKCKKTSLRMGTGANGHSSNSLFRFSLVCYQHAIKNLLTRLTFIRRHTLKMFKNLNKSNFPN